MSQKRNVPIHQFVGCRTGQKAVLLLLVLLLVMMMRDR